MGRFGSGLLGSVLAVAAAGLAATAAFAADLPVPAAAPAYHPPPPAHYNWSGIYVGGHAGVGIEEDGFTDTTATTLENAGTRTHVSPYAIIGGPQAGINLEFAPVVIGVEGTWTSSYLSGNYAIPALAPANSQEESRSAPHWYATATGKIGFAANDLLFYAKGGAAWTHVDYTELTLTGGAFVAQQLLTDNRNGYTVGGGIEYAFNEYLSGKLEYDFLEFGTKNYNFTAMNSGAGLPVSIKAETHMLLAGVNYRYNFGGVFGRY
jgi:outer membrane immunogenic protein